MTAVVLMGVVVSTVVARVVVLVEMAQAVQLGATATVVATFTNVGCFPGLWTCSFGVLSSVCSSCEGF